MALSDTKIRAAKARDKDYKLSDEKGLFLLVKVSGAKYWRLKYRFEGKEKLLALGVYPDTTLANARSKRDEARTHLANGTDPGAAKRVQAAARREAAANSFETIAWEWLAKRGKKSESGDSRLKRLLERDLFPTLGNRAISEITPPQLLQTLRRIEGRGAVETAHRAKQYAGQIFRYAIATGRAERDPSADLKGALAIPNATHFAAITDPTEVGALMRAIRDYRGTPTLKAALRLSPLLFCRPGELRHLEWVEVDWVRKRIELPAKKMKMGQPHIIPLSDQAYAILEEQWHLTGAGKFVFPNPRSRTRPLSENGVRTALRTMGYDNDTMTAHGFRAMARTLLDEVLGYRVDWIEQQLAHAVRDPTGRAYNRTKHLKQRTRMMQNWANYLEKLQNEGPNVISIQFGGANAER